MGTGTAEQAVVLSGGGAHGAYGLGVMEALFSGRWGAGQGEVVEPAVFTGTSVGSFNAAYIVAARGARPETTSLDAVRALRYLWIEQIGRTNGPENGVFRLRGDPREYLGSPWDAFYRLGEDAGHAVRETWFRSPKFVLSQDPLLQRLATQTDITSFVSTQPFHQLVSASISPAGLLDRAAPVLKMATTNWDTGQVMVFTNRPGQPRIGPDVSTKAKYVTRALTEANADRAVLASAAIPGIFPSVVIDDDSYVDGGLLMNTPLHPAISSNAQTLHVVYLDPDLERVPRGEVESTTSTLNRMMAVTFANIKEDVEYAAFTQRLVATANQIKRQGGADVSDPLVRGFLADFAGMTELTVHRYFPTRSLGGVSSMLDFRQQRLIEMIELGFDDTVRHDCQANGCIVPR